MLGKVALTLVLVGCLAAPALGTVTITAGNHILIPNTPNQVVQILISSDIPQGISSADLGLEIVGPPGSPRITAVDMTSPGTVFGDAPGGFTPQVDFEPFPTQNQLSSIATTAGDTSPAAGGVLANVTIDTTGLGWFGVFPFNLIYAPFFLPTSTSSIPAQATVLINGTLGEIPEPSSLVLGLFAAVGFGVVALRRRLRRRRFRC